MLHLFTFGVLLFQAAILVTVIGCAFLGRRWLDIAALGWVAFTLFGSIHTFGLLSLQLVTIAIAYGIGRLIARRAGRRSSGAAA